MAVIELDFLRKKSRAHAAVMNMVRRGVPYAQNDAAISGVADAFLADLWSEGFKIVPRDDKEAG